MMRRKGRFGAPDQALPDPVAPQQIQAGRSWLADRTWQRIGSFLQQQPQQLA